MDAFYQDGPRLLTQYRGDAVLRRTLRRRVPAEVVAQIEPARAASRSR